MLEIFFFSSRRRHTRWNCDWSSDVCSSDLLAAGDVEVFGLGYDDEVLTLAECFDCLGLGHQVSSGLGEMRQPLRDDRPELLLLPAHGFILPYVLYPVDATRRRISRTMPPSRSGRSAGCPPRPGSR